MCRPSVVSQDWIVKGFHLHVGRVELAVRPGHVPGLSVFESCFSGAPERDVDAAIRTVRARCLSDAAVWANWRDTIGRAMQYLDGQTGELADLANGRKAELTFLWHALAAYEAERSTMPPLREFLATGELGGVKPGLRLAQLRDLLGPPDDESVRRRPVYILRYGAAQFAFAPVPNADEYRLASTSIYFNPADRQMPLTLQFSDWTPTGQTTEAMFRQFAMDAGLRPHPDAEWRGGNVMLTSGATATFDGGMLHSLHFHKPGKPAGRKQVTVALPSETVRLLRQRAQDANVTPSDLLDRLIRVTD